VEQEGYVMIIDDDLLLIWILSLVLAAVAGWLARGWRE
jgi:hypothetical protein